MVSRWFPGAQANTRAHVRLFCFPHAGGGASSFARWQPQLPPEIGVSACCLPGHEQRLREPLFESMVALLDALMPELEMLLDRPFALFGHSLGGSIACGVAQRLAAAGGPQPQRLFLSACRARHLPPRLEPMNNLPEGALLEEVQRRYGGLPARILEERDFLLMFLRVLRADLRLFEGDSSQIPPPLSCPISAYGGRDDALVPPADVEAWAQHSAAPGFEFRTFVGGHHYFATAPGGVLEAIATALGYPIRER